MNIRGFQSYLDQDLFLSLSEIMNSESYSPFAMSIFGVEEESQKKDQAWQLWEGNDQISITPTGLFNHAMINTQQNNLQFSSFPDCNPPHPPPFPSLPALPSNNLHQYIQQQPPPPPPPPMETDQYYHAGFVKPVEERVCYGALNIGLNLSHSTSYFPSAETVSFNRLFWRSRGGYYFAHQPPRCQADGCKADLSNAKRYHRRHKVCEFHSKASIVIVSGGLQQRFCQQCSRFHSLDAFDDTKKSCRKRLADHNRRRRKPQISSDHGSQAPSTAKKKLPASKSMNQASSSTRNVSALNQKDLNRWNNLNSQATTLKIGSSLYLGGAGAKNPCLSSQDQINYQEALDDFSEESSEHQLQQQLSSSSSSNIQNLQHQNLSYSASKEVVAHCTGGVITPNLIHQHQSSLLQIRQAMFELDYA